MHCPNCGTACAENALHCTGCGASLSATCEAAPAAPTNDGVAIAALICGILGFFTVFFVSIAAIVLGDMARKKAKENGLESSMADWGYWLGVAGLVLFAVGSLLAITISLFSIFCYVMMGKSPSIFSILCLSIT